MNLWHGHEQHPDAWTDRPWWRGSGLTFLRSDGIQLFLEAYTEWPYNRNLDPRGVVHEGERLDQAMERIDREHPLPVPPPQCGQVWFWPEQNRASQVISVFPENDKTIASMAYRTDGPWDGESWPPTGAVLVAGPSAPWSPPPKPDSSKS
jgi:hypothetical protein